MLYENMLYVCVGSSEIMHSPVTSFSIVTKQSLDLPQTSVLTLQILIWSTHFEISLGDRCVGNV